MNNRNTYEDPLQNYWVFEKAQKDSLESKATISFFMTYFNGTGSGIIGAENPGDEIKLETFTRALEEDEINIDPLHICCNYNADRYFIVCSHLDEISGLKDESPEGSIIRNQLRYLSDVKWYYTKWFRKNKLDLPEIEPVQVSSDSSAELRVAHKKLIEQRELIKALRRHRNKPARSEMVDHIDNTRKKNGDVNYEALARLLGFKDGTTVKNMIKDLGLVSYSKAPHNR